MKVLISSVGLTDPIRDRHDGPLLHIARIYRPATIVLIYSEKMADKHDRIEAALQSIDDYQPEIEVWEGRLKDSEIAIFDTMFGQISKIIQTYRKNYSEEDPEFLLNLSSGTPQIISSFFALNRIQDMDFEGIQVLTPADGPNDHKGYDNDKEIAELIEENLDNTPSPKDRTRLDKSLKFSQILGKRHLKQLISNYDFIAALNMLEEPQSKKWYSKWEKGVIHSRLKQYERAIKFQEFLDLPLKDDEQKKVMTVYLLIDLSIKRGMVADVLIKAKSLVEFVLESYIKRGYPGLICYERTLPKIDETHERGEEVNDYIADQFQKDRGDSYDASRAYNRSSTLNLLSYVNIINCLEPENKIVAHTKIVEGVNPLRNKVAHGLDSIDSKQVSLGKLKQIQKSLQDLLKNCCSIPDHVFLYNDDQRKSLEEQVSN